jgi:hypothetical protein
MADGERRPCGYSKNRGDHEGYVFVGKPEPSFRYDRDLGFHKVDSQLALCLILVVSFLGHELRPESTGGQSLRSPARSHTRTVDPGSFSQERPV